MKNSAIAAFVLATTAVSAPALAQDAEGSWSGTLNAGGMEFPIMIEISRDEDGKLSGTVDSPAQGASGIPLANVTNEDGNFSFSVPMANGMYTSRWDAASGSWDGTWNQSGQFFPVDFHPADRAAREEDTVSE